MSFSPFVSTSATRTAYLLQYISISFVLVKRFGEKFYRQLIVIEYKFVDTLCDFCFRLVDTQQINAIEVYTGTSGIEAVAAEDAEAPVEYYNLQGVRVVNPENGLYIRRQGNSVSKVVIR